MAQTNYTEERLWLLTKANLEIRIPYIYLSRSLDITTAEACEIFSWCFFTLSEGGYGDSNSAELNGYGPVDNDENPSHYFLNLKPFFASQCLQLNVIRMGRKPVEIWRVMEKNMQQLALPVY